MDPLNSTTTSTTTNTAFNQPSFDITSLGDVIGGSFFDTALGFLSTAWTIFAIISYIVSIIMLVIYVYAATGKKQLEKLRLEEIEKREKIYREAFQGATGNSRLVDINEHIESDNPNDWKLAIIEADIILDEALKKLGYAGVSLGERLKSISSSQLDSLDDAWQAHRVRNQIAHGADDFVLTRRLAENTIKQYKRVFRELEVD